MAEHVLKVQPPYFDALADGSKTFEVRRNDRAFQRGDTLVLWEPQTHATGLCHGPDCELVHRGAIRQIRKAVTFVYSGDPRFGGIEPGHVVLALGDDTAEKALPERRS